jgi:hypothetical protein
MKTTGGFEIINFRKLEKPIEFNIKEPHIYEGNILNLNRGHEVVGIQYCTWDKFGRCSNWKREDCFIDVKNIKL